MTLKMGDIPRLNELIGSLAEEKLGFKTSYKLMKLAKEIEVEFTYYRENLVELLNEYGKKDENGELIYEGSGVKIQEDKIEEVSKKIAELDGIEVNLNSPLLEVEELEDMKISLQDVAVLDPLIKKEDN